MLVVKTFVPKFFFWSETKILVQKQNFGLRKTIGQIKFGPKIKKKSKKMWCEKKLF